MKAYLIPVRAGGNPIEVHKDLILIGRHACCDLLLDHKTVSKMHCVLVKDDEELMIRDLGSTNGCRVNGLKVDHGTLRHNDVFSVAIFQYRVQFVPMGRPLPMGPPSAPGLAVDRQQTAVLESHPAVRKGGSSRPVNRPAPDDDSDVCDVDREGPRRP